MSIPVIAVFGGSRRLNKTILETAERIGYEIAQRRCVALTGGSGAGTATVRDQAIEGAKRSVRDGSFGAWVGVARSPDVRQPEPDALGLRIYPGYEHKRNYVEARLCDAAIALPGREGTASEVAFCLALGRPVVLLGPAWKDGFPLAKPNRRRTLTALRKQAQTAISRKEITPSPLDGLIASALDCLVADRDLGAWAYEPLPGADDASAVVGLVLRMLQSTDRREGPPDLPEYQDTAAAYAAWIVGAQQRADRASIAQRDDGGR